MTALFHESFPSLLKPGALVTIRAGAGPISWHERLKIQHLMGANHWCMSSKRYTLVFNCLPLAFVAQKAWHSSCSACCPESHDTNWRNGALLPSGMWPAALLQQPAPLPAGQRSLFSANPPIQHINKTSADSKSSISLFHSPNTVKYSPKYYKMLLSLSPCTYLSCYQLQGPLPDCFKIS